MKRYAVLLALTLTLALPGCASWAQRYRDTPVAAFTQDVAYMNLALGIARTAVAQAGTPADMERFEHIAGQVQRGLATAVDGVRIGANLGQPQPNYTQLLGDARSAMGNLNAFIQGFSTEPGRAADPMLREAVRATARAAQL